MVASGFDANKQRRNRPLYRLEHTTTQYIECFRGSELVTRLASQEDQPSHAHVHQKEVFGTWFAETGALFDLAIAPSLFLANIIHYTQSGWMIIMVLAQASNVGAWEIPRGRR